MGFRKNMLLNSHGHHAGPLRIVTRQITDAHDVCMALVAPAQFGHPQVWNVPLGCIDSSLEEP